MINPLVSVLMTAYNRERYIAEAIESVIHSTYQSWELIIVDDCSSDNTVNIARDYERRDNRVKLYINEKNLGDYPNRNKAASYAKGDYIIWVDSDDKLYKEAISLLLDSMLKYPSASFGIYYPWKDKPEFPVEISSPKAIRKHFFKQGFLTVGPGGTIQKLSFFMQLQGYPIMYGPANDMYYNLKAACHSPVVLIPFDFLYYRQHAGQEKNASYKYLYSNYNYLRDALNQLPLGLTEKEFEFLDTKNKRRFVTNLWKYFFSSYNFKKAIMAYRLAGFST